jgi:hypothetical protein
MHQRQKGLAQLLVPCRNAATLFELVEEPFHLLASRVQVVIIIYRGRPIALARDPWHDVLCQEVLADVMAVRGLVHHRMGQRWLWRPLGEPRLKDGTLMRVACREDYRNAGAFIAAAGMDFGGPAAPRAAQSLCDVATVFFERAV